jgi:hypothetical protein
VHPIVEAFGMHLKRARRRRRRHTAAKVAGALWFARVMWRAVRY